MHATHRCFVAIASLLIATPAILPAQADGRPISFNKVWVRGARSATDIRMETTPADMAIDTVARRLVVKNKRLPLNISLDQVKKLTFDVSSHMRGGRGSGGGLLGAVIAASIQGEAVSDHWCVIDYLDDAGVSHRYLLEIGNEQAGDVLALLTQLLPSAVEESRFAEEQREVPQEEMAPFNDDYEVTVLKENRPSLPAVHPESALVVVAAPTVEYNDAGRGEQYRLYANRNIVAVNKMGTYAFFHLAPGTYSLLSKAGNVSVLDVTVETGTTYYFFQNTFMGFTSGKTRLTRQTEALVRQEVTGMYFAEWRRVNAIGALEQLGEPEATAALMAAATSTDEAVRRGAIQALAKSPADSVVQFVIALAGQPGPAQEDAVSALGESNVASALVVIRQVAATSSPPQVRAAAIRALATLGDTASAGLVAAAISDDDKDVAHAAIGAAATIAGPSKTTTLTRGLLSRHKAVRSHAASELARNPDTSAIRPLWDAFQKERDGMAAGAMADALIKAGWLDRGAIAWLVEGLDKPDTKTWFARTRLLAHLTGQSFGPSSQYVTKQEHTKALSRWRRWWAAQPGP